MKIMLTGASGLLGRAIYSTLKDTNEVRGYAFSRTQGELHKLDLTDEAAVKNEITAFKPDLIIHSAAERSPDVCEKDHPATLALNVQACEHLCKSAAQVNA
ncbi:MAG: sugar nucleotide-binding protein, partial [Lentisphaeraceae bacterium]|nr:sugar nucleotide-binding protein [Lentisphaeraceae bacterium]